MERRGLGVAAAILIAGSVSVLVSTIVSVTAWSVLAYLESDLADEWGEDVDTEGSDEDADFAPLEQPAGETLSLTIDADDDKRNFSFDVPADAVAVRVRVEAASQADIDLFVAFGETAARDEDWWRESVEDDGEEEIMLVRHDFAGFASGPLFVQVQYFPDDDEDEAEIGYTLRVDVVPWRALGPHEPGDEMRGVLDVENGHRTSFEVRVPEGARAMRFDLVDVDQDLDLYVSPRADSYDTSEAEHAADSEVSRESLLLDGDSEPPIDPGGSLFVTVTDRYPLPEPTAFRLLATAAREPPASLSAAPEWPPASGARARALSSVVELITDDGGGSGTLVRADGLVLTAFHVVDGLTGDAPIVVAVNLDARAPARDAFRARVLHTFEDEDLALVQIVSDLYRRPLPRDYRFPACPVGWSALPIPGDVVHTIGYPSIGGWTGRGPITFSTGVLSGHGVTDSGPKLKTDALISSGSSGGAALDAAFRLVGVPTQTRWESKDGSETLGYASPVDRIPDEWRRLIQVPVK